VGPFLGSGGVPEALRLLDTAASRVVDRCRPIRLEGGTALAHVTSYAQRRSGHGDAGDRRMRCRTARKLVAAERAGRPVVTEARPVGTMASYGSPCCRWCPWRQSTTLFGPVTAGVDCVLKATAPTCATAPSR
jgi:hypothetical protein